MRKTKTSNRAYEDACRRLVFWRDGGECVLRSFDGGHCDGVIQWGHLIPRSASAVLKFSIANTFCQCASHNLLHRYNPSIFFSWYAFRFGPDVLYLLQKYGCQSIKKFSPSYYEDEMNETLRLLENRPSVHDFGVLVRMGYYGKIAAELFSKKGVNEDEHV